MWLRRQQGKGFSDLTMATTALNGTGSSSSYLQIPGTTRSESRAVPVAYSSQPRADFSPELVIRLQLLQWDPRQAASHVKIKSEIPLSFFLFLNIKDMILVQSETNAHIVYLKGSHRGTSLRSLEEWNTALLSAPFLLLRKTALQPEHWLEITLNLQ